MSLPPLVVVSIDSCRLRKPTFGALEGGDRPDEVLERPPEAIEFPDDEGIARAEEGEGSRQAGAIILGPAGHVGEDPRAAGRGEGIALQVEVLVLGRDACVADEQAAPG